MKGNITKDLAWKLFRQTGEIRYYMLYSSLKKNEEEDEREDGL